KGGGRAASQVGGPERGQAVRVAKKDLFRFMSPGKNGPDHPVGAERVAGEVIHKLAPPAGAAPQEILDLFREMTEDPVKFRNPPGGQELHHVLDERAVCQPEHRPGVAVVQGVRAGKGTGCYDNGSHLLLFPSRGARTYEAPLPSKTAGMVLSSSLMSSQKL